MYFDWRRRSHDGRTVCDGGRLCDRGGRRLKLHVEPDLIIGDCDSMTEQEKLAVEQLQQTVPEKICRLPECKDDTDMLAAIKRGLELGYTDFRIYAATGGRFDHTLANIQCLLYLKNHGAVGYLVDGTGMVLVLQNEGGKRREYPRHEISFGKCRDHQRFPHRDQQ